MSRTWALLVILAFAIAACNGVQDDEPAAPPPEEEPAADPDEETVTIVAVDYDFEEVPDTVPVGTQLTLDNQGEEPHEMVVFAVPDEEERSVQELLALPEDEEPQLDFKGVAIDFGGDAAGDPVTPQGPVILDEPGRYAMVCFFPVGMTNDDLEAAFEQQQAGEEGPPPLPEGPPHFTEGMWAEFHVE